MWGVGGCIFEGGNTHLYAYSLCVLFGFLLLVFLSPLFSPPCAHPTHNPLPPIFTSHFHLSCTSHQTQASLSDTIRRLDEAETHYARALSRVQDLEGEVSQQQQQAVEAQAQWEQERASLQERLGRLQKVNQTRRQEMDELQAKLVVAQNAAAGATAVCVVGGWVVGGCVWDICRCLCCVFAVYVCTAYVAPLCMCVYRNPLSHMHIPHVVLPHTHPSLVSPQHAHPSCVSPQHTLFPPHS